MMIWHLLRDKVQSISFWCLILLITLQSGMGQALANQTTEWTIMVYLDGDNDLEYWGIVDLLEMEQALPPNVEIVVLFDRHKGYSKDLGDWTNTRLYRLRKAPPFDMSKASRGLNVPLPQNLSAELLEDWGECDMGDPATLTRFIKTVAQRFPAKRYAFIPWDHGSGAAKSGMFLDHDRGSGKPGTSHMSIRQFAEAVREGARALPRQKFDLLKYELCLMGQLDVLGESEQLADYVLASPPFEPALGSDYLNILPWFRQDVSTATLVSKMVAINIAFYNQIERQAAFSAFAMQHMKLVTEKFNALTEALSQKAAQQFKGLTRASCFATHYDNVLIDLGRGQDAISSVDVYDWLDRLQREVDGIDPRLYKDLKAALAQLTIASATTDNFPECRGLAMFLPLQRVHCNVDYPKLLFAQKAGLLGFLQLLYTAQETLGNDLPQIHDVQLGTPKAKPQTNATRPEDFTIVPLTHLTPFSRNVVRFAITGTGILYTTMVQFEQVGERRYIHCEQLLAEHNPDRGANSNIQNAFSFYSPRYNDGTTVFMRELAACYKVSNGANLGNITVINMNISKELGSNVSIAYGLYRDGTTGGQDLNVQVHFSNRLRIPLKIVAFTQDQKGRTVALRDVQLRADGFFRPARLYLDGQLKLQREYGPPLPVANRLLLLTTDMLAEGNPVGCLIRAHTMHGKVAQAISNTLPVKYVPAQMLLKDNAKRLGLINLPGRYAMVQFASSQADAKVILPTFQTLEFKPNSPFMTFTHQQGQKIAKGLVNWLPYGMPQFTLHEKSNLPGTPLGRTIEAFYAFLDGQGKERVWYLVQEGIGTRWALVPLEHFQPAALEGIWVSPTERWEFHKDTVTLKRADKTYSAQYTLTDHILQVNNFPAPKYALYLDAKHGHLNLMTEDSRVSILQRPKDTNTKIQVEPKDLLGSWISSQDTGYARLNISSIPGTNFYNLRLLSRGQGHTVCTYAFDASGLRATFADGSHVYIPFKLEAGQLTLYFPHMPPISFTKNTPSHN